MMKQLILFLFLTLTSLVTWAKTQTVTLDVPNMTCGLCPTTIKKALMGVDGVSTAQVTLSNKHAVVTYDDAKTNVKALISATTNAGYPSFVKK